MLKYCRLSFFYINLGMFNVVFSRTVFPFNSSLLLFCLFCVFLRLLEIRSRLYELLTHCIPPDVILKVRPAALLSRTREVSCKENHLIPKRNFWDAREMNQWCGLRIKFLKIHVPFQILLTSSPYSDQGRGGVK